MYNASVVHTEHVDTAVKVRVGLTAESGSLYRVRFYVC